MQKNRLKTTIFYRLEKQLGPDNNTYLAQIITPEMAKLGPDNNFTVYIYIYIWPRPRFRAYVFRHKIGLKLGKKYTFRPKKARPILVVLFCSFPFPFFASKWLKYAVFAFKKAKKSRQKTRPPPYIYIYMYINIYIYIFLLCWRVSFGTTFLPFQEPGTLPPF